MLSEAVPALRREKMSTVDTAWLRMDSDGNLMMIVAVLMFDRPLDMQRFRRAMETRFLKYSRFRSRVTRDMTGSAWWQQEEIDLDYHIVRSSLPDAGRDGNKKALERMVAELSGTPLDFSRPLWQMHIVDNCVGEDGKTRQGVIIRIHHCIADGMALVGVLLSMFDRTPEGADEEQEEPLLPEEDNPWLDLMRPVTKTTITAINLSTALWTKTMWMMADSNKLPGRMADMGGMAGRLTLDAVKLMAMPDDSRTRLKGAPRGAKHVAWSEPLPLDEIKVVGKALGGSVNDVLMASVAGAIGAYLRDKGDTVPADTELRAMVPVNLRKAGKEQKLGNAFGLVPLVLPVGIEDPVARLNEVRRRMDELKGGYQALVAMAVLGVLGATPKQMQNEIQNYFARKATAVMSNVPGPQAPLYLAGSKLDQIMFWVPQSGDIGVGVSILSYNGGVQFGLVTDDAIASDPHEIIKRFAPEFEKLVLLALMSDW
ncbi:wax ester/triacylglycerol synthase family O-acyltransferase [Noviherbaspirillum sp.]|uniref:wax ester/triacylglycerol synthase family O-acyltransferase n=1 Tax=Noviherbaspirillum sp. TaxID=1926288 RepID=UPI002D4711C6|nr:wax ester/triacylglycerol synthase family O-acyltransferase [Noviherbaspirillum sp.]HZW19849.1 wax ester/triacylglycerol synthase family O-acyltransferase [Noviherbaspirillum sp.]